MKWYKLGPMLVGVIIFVLTILTMGPVTQDVISFFWLKPGVIEAAGAYQNPTVYEGTILQRQAFLSSDILPVYGSSEFSAVSDFHPAKIFAGQPTGFSAFLVGRGGSQDLIHAIALGAQGNVIKGKKLGIILSPQWFTPDGLSEGYFDQNFSPLQVYKMLFDSSLSQGTKQRLAERLLQYQGVWKDYPTLEKILKHYGKQDLRSRLAEWFYIAQGRVEMAALQVRDALRVVKYVRKNKPSSPMAQGSDHPGLAWDNLLQQADSMGKAQVTNNGFGVNDSYFNQYVQPNLQKSKDSATDSKLYPSPEYADLELLMQVLKETGARPIFVIVPVNGRWYNYTGFPRQERTNYYKRVVQMIQSNGYPVADFSSHEYDLYFLQDIMHLGWKGWVYVDKALDGFFHGKG